MENNARTVKKLFRGKWVDVPHDGVKKGMKVRVYDPDGIQIPFEGVVYDYFLVSGDSYIHPIHKAWTFSIIDPTSQK